jgi:hypothetical protein
MWDENCSLISLMVSFVLTLSLKGWIIIIIAPHYIVVLTEHRQNWSSCPDSILIENTVKNALIGFNQTLNCSFSSKLKFLKIKFSMGFILFLQISIQIDFYHLKNCSGCGELFKNI